MVLSDPYNPVSKGPPPSVIAPVADRGLALFVDFLLFSPLCALVGSPLVREIYTALLTDPRSVAAEVAVYKLILAVYLLGILFQSIFTYVWKATPGQKLMKLRVVSMSDRGVTSYYQCLVRSFMWWSTGLFVLPSLGVFTHPLRRTFPDLASDTIVVTDKAAPRLGPGREERLFFTSWKTAALAVSLFFFSMILFQWEAPVESRVVTVAASECGEAQSVDDLDALMTEVHVKNTGPECLGQWANDALWTSDDPEWRSMAYLAKSMATTEDRVLSEVYLKRACDAKESGEACALSKYLRTKDEKRGDLLRSGGLGRTLSRVMLLEDSVARGQAASAMALVGDLRSVTSLEGWLLRQELKVVWTLRDSSSRRQPASEEGARILKEFKTRYELP